MTDDIATIPPQAPHEITTRTVMTAVDRWLDTDEVLDMQGQVKEDLVETAKITVVATNEDYAGAGASWAALKVLDKTAEDFYDLVKIPCRTAWKKITAEQKDLHNCIASEKQRIGKLIVAFQQRREQERIAEETRLRLEAQEAERARIAAAKRLEDAAKAAEAREREAQAAEARASGEIAAAQAIEEAPSTVKPVLVEPELPIMEPQVSRSAFIPKVEGIGGSRDHWCAEITDLGVFVKGIADGVIPLDAALGIKAVDQSNNYRSVYLNKHASKLLVWPGTRVWNEKIATGSRK